MKRNPYYTLQRINHTPYLIPFGQAVTEHRRSVALNESGEVLWHLLEQDYSFEELVRQAAAYYELSWEQTAGLSADIRSFVDHLFREGILLENSLSFSPKEHSVYLRIADITIQLDDSADKLQGLFPDFEIPDPHDLADMRVVLTSQCQTSAGMGTVLVHTPQLKITEYSTTYEMEFPLNQCVKSLSLSKNGKLAIYRHVSAETTVFREEFYHALRQSFLYLAWQREMLVLHSASLLYQGKAYLFSGHSGMGKSTHVELWHTLYHTTLLNGDLNLIVNTHNGPMVKGIPWCGTSGIFSKGTYPLGGIVLLARDVTDHTRELTAEEKTLSVSKRLISPCWNASQLEKNLTLTHEITSRIPVCRLYCTKNESAARVMKQYIDGL